MFVFFVISFTFSAWPRFSLLDPPPCTRKTTKLPSPPLLVVLTGGSSPKTHLVFRSLTIRRSPRWQIDVSTG